MQIRDGTQALRVFHVARSVMADVRDLRRNASGLMRLDAQLAAANAIPIAILSVITFLFVLTGWALLVSALVALIADNWLSLPATLVVVALIVLVAAIPCVVLIKGRASNLAFEATRRQMGGPTRPPQASKSTEQIRREIAVLESRISGEKQNLQSALYATRGLLRDTLSSRKARTGLVVAAVAAGALAGLRARSLARSAGGNRESGR